MSRFQRRENFRAKIPLAHALRCNLCLDPVRNATTTIRIFDVSGGGIALVGYPSSLALIPGQIYRSCGIDLPELGRVTTDLEIIHVLKKRGHRVTGTRFAGCRFRNMSNAMLTLIHRYVNKVECGQSALA